MTRRLTGVLLLVCWCLLASAAGASAEVPAGPRLTYMEMGDAGFRLISADPAGGDRRMIVGGNFKKKFLPFPFSRPSWSSDGARVAFTGIAASGKEAVLDVYDASADGAEITKLPGTHDGLAAVLSPDGRTLAFAREREHKLKSSWRGEEALYRSVSIWLLDIETGTVRRLSPWRNGLSAYPSSFSPDGSTLAISREWRERSSAMAMRLDGAGTALLARDATDPVYSPDGTRLALTTLGKPRTLQRKGESLTYEPSELAVAAADGSGLTRLTHTHNLELTPSWDPSGQRIAYTLLSPVVGEANFLGAGDAIMEINADGSCKTRILSLPKVTLFGATWQPGPGREAGPIAC